MNTKPIPSTNLYTGDTPPTAVGHVSVRVDRDVYKYFHLSCPKAGGMSQITRFLLTKLYNECLAQGLTEPSYEHCTKLSAILDGLNFGVPRGATPIPHASDNPPTDQGTTRGKRKKVA